MSYSLSQYSRRELEGVEDDLVRCVERAILITEADFRVVDGMRTVEEQRAYVRAGTSKTMRSKHLKGQAVDLVPWINGKPRWEWPPIYKIAAAMHSAATSLNVMLRWGGVWDRCLNNLPGDPAGLKRAVEEYQSRHPGPDFLDGPHYELML